jgi:cobalt-zinc-cadmium efflux system membrane fusion protein
MAPKVLAALTTLAALALSCTTSETPAEDAPTASPLTDEVAWTHAEPAERLSVLRRPARVVVPRSSTWVASPGVSARLLSWQVGPGDRVSPGDAIATLASPELSDLDAAVRRLRQIVGDRKVLVSSREKAVEQGFKSVDSLNEARLSLSEAEAELTRLRSKVSARGRNVESSSNSEWTWLSSAAGVVTEIACAPGSAVSADTPCLRVEPTENLVVAVDIPARESARLEPTVVATVGETTLTFVGRSHVVSERQTETFRFGAPDGARPGEAFLVDIDVPAPDDAVVVPRLAIVSIDGTPSVFVEGPNGPEPRAITELGRLHGDRIVRGVAPGDRVVARGAFVLKSELAFP